ncbi:response regulator transcription factor [Salmonella enterica]|nr:helix-turn-helix transcriptional regulator [Salmonella enterica]EJF5595122.1 helix-turn-helix transcriptional regulator [Salmonella enterica]EJF5826251.1 helix-turn-helix transcriptional regulator [Salmonella enterica]EJF5844910.1 helix-turn-helix transcriptional regulator [Salmonella enterica]EJF5917400.1 helix-turn-helix transcriptional regulator [Salmonella enterica]
MHIFTTSQDVWAQEGLRHALAMQGVTARVTGVDVAGDLFGYVGSGSGVLPVGSVLLPVFPDDQVATCLKSLNFLKEWQSLQCGLLRLQAPCLLWGRTSVLRFNTGCTNLTLIPWRIRPQDLGGQIVQGVKAWNRPGRRQSRVRMNGLRDVRVNLTSREVQVLRHTLEGRSLAWIAQELGVADKTVWTYRRRAMDVLGVRRLRDLMMVQAAMLS